MILVLMNLYEYALGKTDINETLAVLIDFEKNFSEGYIFGHDRFTDETVFLYYNKIAQCYMHICDYNNADKYFEKADEYSKYLELSEKSTFICEWAKCNAFLGQLVVGEQLAINGLEYLMQASVFPIKEWNELCKVYADILMKMNKTKEANDWLAEMIEE